MSAAVEQETVRALVVEDNPTLRNSFLNVIRKKGFDPIGVGTSKEAMRQVRSLPGLDIVITDMDLHEKGVVDTAGEALARQIKKSRVDLPIVAYTAHEDYENRVDWKLFDHRLEKGTISGIIETGLEKCKEIALSRRRLRLQHARTEIQRLAGKYEIDRGDISVLRKFLPGLHALQPDSVAEEPDSDVGVNELLRRLKIRLNFIHTGAHPIEVGEESITTLTPVPVWIDESSGVAVAEVYDFPQLYGVGDTEDEAMKAILLLMFGFHNDLRTQPVLGPESDRLKKYLSGVFGE